MIGQTLDRFRITGPIEPGGTSQVYLADEIMGEGATRPAAVKVLLGVNVADEAGQRRFHDEVDALIRLGNAPHIVEIRACGTCDGLAWIAMEHLPASLETLITDEPAPPGLIEKIIRDVATGLDTIHRAGMLHRDIKPANILQSRFGDFKIADFGLASLVSAQATRKTATCRYTSPESLDPSLGFEGPPSDLYSLGFVAYLAALGRRRFAEQFPWTRDGDPSFGTPDDLRKWMAWHIDPKLIAPPVHQVVAGFPVLLSRTIDRLIAKPIDQRFASAAELLNGSAGAATDSAPRTAQPASLPTRSKTDGPAWSGKPSNSSARPASRRIVLLAGALILAMALLVFTFTLPKTIVPVITLEQEAIRSQSSDVRINGTIRDLPPGGRLLLERDGAAAVPLRISEGRFMHALSLPTPQTVEARVVALHEGRRMASRSIRVERVAPEKVSTTFVLTPADLRAGLRVAPADRSDGVETRVDLVNGRGTAELAPGTYTVELDDPEYELVETRRFETQFEPQRQVALRAVSRIGTLRFKVLPPTARLKLAPADGGEAVDIPLNPLGVAERKMLAGSYVATLEADGYEPRTDMVRVHAERKQPVELTLQRVPATRPAPLTSPVEQWSMDDMMKFVREQAPAAGLSLEPVTAMRTVRVTGHLLNTMELTSLGTRLGPVMSRLQMDVKVDPDFVRQKVVKAVREAGGQTVQGLLKGRTGEEVLVIEYDLTDAMPSERARAIAESFVLDRRFASVRGFER